MIQKHCFECGTALIEKELEEEGIVPYCPKCQQYRFPMYNVAVSMIVVDEETGKILLIQQYGKPSYILVAGYVNRGEAEEHAVVREVREETGLEVEHLRFNRTKFFEPSNTLMCNLAIVLPRWDTYCVNCGTQGVSPRTPSIHRLRRGLPGYLILFAPHAFEPQRQLPSSKPPSPLVFLLISTHFTATLGIPLASPSLKGDSFKCSLWVKPIDFTSDLSLRLRALYTQ